MIRKVIKKARAAVESLLNRARLSWLLWQKGRAFSGKENFDLASVQRGFQDQPCHYPDDTEILDRTISAYHKAKEAQKSAGTAYQVSNEWLPIYEEPLQKVMQALRNGDRNQLRSIYRNFMRDRCSTGLHGLPLDMLHEYFSGKITRKNRKRFLVDMYHRYTLWKSLLGNTHSLKDLVSPCIGNPYGYYFGDTFIRAGADYLHYYATAIARLTRNPDRKAIVELGGGYGGMAYYLCRDNRNMTYLDFDLPENLALASYYLLCAFPDKKTLLFGEGELTPDTIAEKDIILMPGFEIAKLHDRSVDLVFNSYSLAEMSRETIRTYIGHFTRITKGYFLHVNHNKRSEVVADDFGIDPAHFDLLYKIPALWNAGRDMLMDEYEYLYKKI